MAFDRKELITFLEDKMGLDPSEISNETLMFSEGILDSFSMVDLVMFLESSMGEKISPGEVTLDNLDSVERIERFVESRQNG